MVIVLREEGRIPWSLMIMAPCAGTNNNLFNHCLDPFLPVSSKNASCNRIRLNFFRIYLLAASLWTKVHTSEGIIFVISCHHEEKEVVLMGSNRN